MTIPDPLTTYDRPTFDGKAAQEYTGLSSHQLDRARWAKKLSYYRPGNVVKYSQRQLDDYLRSTLIDASAAE